MAGLHRRFLRKGGIKDAFHADATMIYRDREEAGKLVAARLAPYRGKENLLVLALPRGGVVLGRVVAEELACPLDVIIVRKLGFPGQPELAMGAVSETGAVVLNRQIIEMGGVSEQFIKEEVAREKEVIDRRKQLYREGKDIPPLKGKAIILVDDGVATGATMKAAISALGRERPDRIVAALPVCSVEAEREISAMVDECVCLETPADFMAIGAFYEDFTQVSDEEVISLLKGKSHG